MPTQDKETFIWIGEHQEAFDLLKYHLTSAPVLDYSDFSQPFELETDTSLKGFDDVLSQRDENDTSHVIAYTSWSLQPNEGLMPNYNSVKLELLALKRAVKEKLRDYLLASRFTIYTDNNPLTYVKGSKLGVAHIWWLSKLALFSSDIKSRTGKLNQAADALRYHPKLIEDNSNNNDCEEYETISHTVVCDDLCEIIKGEKLPLDIKRAVQTEMTKQEQ